MSVLDTWAAAVIQTTHAKGAKKNMEAWASPAAPGLAIHLDLSNPKLTWTVTHIGTGYAVLRGLEGIEQAASAAIALSSALDWSGTVSEILARATPGRLEAIGDAVAAQYGGHR